MHFLQIICLHLVHTPSRLIVYKQNTINSELKHLVTTTHVKTMAYPHPLDGPINPPPPHPHLDVHGRDFYRNYNALPCSFWLPCRHVDDVAIQVYEHFGDAGRLFFRCAHFRVRRNNTHIISYFRKTIYLSHISFFADG